MYLLVAMENFEIFRSFKKPAYKELWVIRNWFSGLLVPQSYIYKEHQL